MRKLYLFTDASFDSAMEKAGLDKKDYSNEQLAELREGAKNGVDLKVFSNPDLTDIQMRIIRWGLEEGLDAAAYADPKLSYTQMHESYLEMERKVSFLGEFDRMLANVV